MRIAWPTSRYWLLALTLLLTMASAAAAQPPYPATAGTYHPLPPGLLPVPQVAPGSSFYYAPPLPAPPAPVVYTQKYSFYTTPTVTYYPPQYSSPYPTFPSNNVYYETNLLAPYAHTSQYHSEALTPLLYGNTSPKTTAPYNTPMFFRY